MFAKVDDDSNGFVDKTERQNVLDDMAASSGIALGHTDDLLKKMDRMAAATSTRTNAMPA